MTTINYKALMDRFGVHGVMAQRFRFSKSSILAPIIKELSGQSEILKSYGGLISASRKAFFLAQIAHETDSFKTLEEYASGAAYENRKDLGNTDLGDGVRFKGRGYIQLTGRSNYEAMAKKFNLPLADFTTKLKGAPEFALAVSAQWWLDHKLNDLADKGDFKGVTKRINGGYNGLESRTVFLKFFESLLL